MKSFGYLAVILICLVAVPLFAQDKAAEEAAAAPTNNMDIVRDAIRAEKKVLIAENMGLTEAEATAFWPIYEKYQDAQKALGDRDIKLIKEYAANYEAMTDEVAEKLIKEAIDIDQERVKLAHTFLPKFQKVLGGKKVARYYQLENKIQAVIDYDLAAQIPLVD
jgi:hypothetical protein